MNESIACWLIKFFGVIFRFLPARLAVALGRAIGLLGYLISYKHRSLAYANLKIAFARTKKASEIKRILRKVFKNYGQHFVELLRLPITDPFQCITVEGKEHVDEALKKKKGVILLAMHFGSWELCNFMGRLLGHPYKVMVNPQPRYRRLDELLNSYRQKAGAGLISSDNGARDFLRTLKNNEIVGIVVDQGGKEGELVKFFGRLASMSVGAVKIGIKMEVPVCFCVLIREKGARHRLVIQPALDLVRSGAVAKDIVSNLGKIVTIMEGYITQHPSQYMWFYKIWKYSKESTTVILNDRRTGHLRQSQAMAQMVAQALSERGIQNTLEVIDIEFKDKAREKVFSTLTFLSHQRLSQGRLRYLKWFLRRKSFLEVMSVKGDFVISCGSSTAGVNYLLAQDYRAKSIAIQRPGVLGFDRFDLVVLPEHDRKDGMVESKHLVFTQLAPNLINRAYLSDQVKNLKAKYPLLEHRSRLTVGLLLGGDSKEHTVAQEQVFHVVCGIKGVWDELDATLLATTSRRTSPEIEAHLVQELAGQARCPFLILARENNVPEAVGGILGLSDIVIVSSDSISMVSEAVSSGKKVIVFKARARRSSVAAKHDRFVERLHREHYLFLAQEEHKVAELIRGLCSSAIQNAPVDDTQKLLEAARGVI